MPEILETDSRRPIILRNGNAPWYDRAEIIRLYESGLSYRAVSEKIGCSYTLTKRVISKAGKARPQRKPLYHDRIAHYPEFFKAILAEAKRVPLEPLARKTGIGADMLYRYFNGRRIPSVSVAAWIAQALGYRITLEPINDVTRKESAGKDHNDPSEPHNDPAEPRPADQPT